MKNHRRNAVLFGLFCGLLIAAGRWPAASASGFAPREESSVDERREGTAYGQEIDPDPAQRVPGGDTGGNDQPFTGGFSDDNLAEPEPEGDFTTEPGLDETPSDETPLDELPQDELPQDEPAFDEPGDIEEEALPGEEEDIIEQEPDVVPDTGGESFEEEPGMMPEEETVPFEEEPGMLPEEETAPFDEEPGFEEDTGVFSEPGNESGVTDDSMTAPDGLDEQPTDETL